MEKSEILEPLHACLREVLERDKNGNGQNITYTDDDVVAATLMFAHIMSNRLIHNLTDEKVSIGMSQHLAASYGVMIQNLAFAMSRVDVSQYYKRKEANDGK